ncbi:MAG: DUF4845 domain-containing protein [Xanthomonadales bacterium]|nr:DUF4845 domain-containing protein [Xanthomonadales bacterium]
MLPNPRARGITLIGFLVVLGVLGFFAYLAMRLVPIYLEFYTVSAAMDKVKSEIGIQNANPIEARKAFMRYLEVDYVDSIQEQHVTVTRERGRLTLRVKYEIEKPFIDRIHLVGKFDRAVELTGRPGAD